MEFVPAYKWLLRRIQDKTDGTVQIQPDMMYFDKDSGVLNFYGHVHLHLLIAKQFGLKKISYEWKEMPLVVKSGGRKVTVDNKKAEGKCKQLRKGHGNRRKTDRVVDQRCISIAQSVQEDLSESPPLLVEMMDD